LHDIGPRSLSKDTRTISRLQEQRSRMRAGAAQKGRGILPFVEVDRPEGSKAITAIGRCAMRIKIGLRLTDRPRRRALAYEPSPAPTRPLKPCVFQRGQMRERQAISSQPSRNL